MNTSVADLIATNRPVLFDFDGPICSVFAGHPAPSVAQDLRDLAVNLGAVLDDGIRREGDPLEILRWSAHTGNPSILRAVEDGLTFAEVHAVDSAEPTPFAHDLLRLLHTQGRSAGIASNNSEGAIAKYLACHGLTYTVQGLAGRQPYAPERMKPDPRCLQIVTERLEIDSTMCVYVGGSMSDIEAAHALGMPVVAYANKPSKAERFREAGAEAVITTILSIREALTSQQSW